MTRSKLERWPGKAAWASSRGISKSGVHTQNAWTTTSPWMMLTTPGNSQSSLSACGVYTYMPFVRWVNQCGNETQSQLQTEWGASVHHKYTRVGNWAASGSWESSNQLHQRQQYQHPGIGYSDIVAKWLKHSTADQKVPGLNPTCFTVFFFNSPPLGRQVFSLKGPGGKNKALLPFTTCLSSRATCTYKISMLLMFIPELQVALTSQKSRLHLIARCRCQWRMYGCYCSCHSNEEHLEDGCRASYYWLGHGMEW